MKKLSIFFITVLYSSLMFAQSAEKDEMEIKQLILSNFEKTNKGKLEVVEYSKNGLYGFNSTGGLLVYTPKALLKQNAYDNVKLEPKHITVISLVPGQAAVAMFYSEGSMKPKGSGSVPHYLTRVSQTYVKEDGSWVIRTGHYSPITGGSGTTQIGSTTEDKE